MRRLITLVPGWLLGCSWQAASPTLDQDLPRRMRTILQQAITATPALARRTVFEQGTVLVNLEGLEFPGR
jgi:hypothetical protein